MPDLIRFSDEIQSALVQPEFINAMSVAARIASAPTPTSDETAAVLTDAAKVCSTAAKKAEAELKSITGPLREAEAAARNLARPVIEQLNGAVATAKQRLGEWIETKRTKAAEEQARLDKIAAEERARVARETAAAQRIAAEGEMPVPAVVPASVPAPTIAAPSQARGSMGLASGRRNLKVAAVDLAKIAAARPEWLTLIETYARDGFKSEVAKQNMQIMYRTGETPDPTAGEPAAIEAFAKIGIRAWYEQGVSLR